MPGLITACLVRVTRSGAGPARWTMGRGSETCYGCDRRSRGCSRRSDLIFAFSLCELCCEPVPGFEGPSAVAVDARMQACMQEGPAKQGPSQAGSKARCFCSIAARHVRTIAHAIDGARYDLHGFGGGSPGESGGQVGRCAVAQARQGRAGQGQGHSELQSRRRLVYSRTGDMGARSQGWESDRLSGERHAKRTEQLLWLLPCCCARVASGT